MYCLEVIFRDEDKEPEYFEIDNQCNYEMSDGGLYINPVKEGRLKCFPMDVIFSVECYLKKEDDENDL